MELHQKKHKRGGRVQTPDGIERIRQSKLGSRNPMFGKHPWNWKKKMPQSFIDLIIERNKSRVYTKELRQKYSEVKKGNKHPNWKGGITPINKRIRQSLEYKLWRVAVFERDNYTCVWCGFHGSQGVLNADHIKPFSLFPEFRFAIDNGRTLCVSCHESTETYKGRIHSIK